MTKKRNKTSNQALKAITLYILAVTGSFILINIIIPLVSVYIVALAFGK